VGQHHRARETRFRRRSPSSGEQDGQWLARRAAENLAVAFQAALLVRHAPSAVADAFCAGRLGEARGLGLGTLPQAASTAWRSPSARSRCERRTDH